MAGVTFPAAIGGDNSTVTDDANGSTGLANGGHKTRLVPMLAQIVAVATYVVGQITTSLASMATSLNTASNAATTATTQAGNAAGSATTATTQAGIATTKASEAAASAAAAAVIVGFDAPATLARITALEGRPLPVGTPIAGATVLASNMLYRVNSTTGPFNLTLPPTPAQNDAIEIEDVVGSFEDKPVTLVRNGATIMGLTEDLVLNIDGARLTLQYIGTDWRLV